MTLCMPFWRRVRWMLWCVLMPFLASCNNRPMDLAPNTTNTASTAGASNGASLSQADSGTTDTVLEPSDISLQLVTWEQTQAIVQSHKGKIVVLDIWSTYCPPCVRELPGLVEVHRRFGQDVACLTLNCNYTGSGSPEDESDQARKILARVQADLQNLQSSEPDQTIYQKVGIASIPVVQVYGRDGTLVKQFDNEQGEFGDHGFNYKDHIIPFVETLLRGAEGG